MRPGRGTAIIVVGVAIGVVLAGVVLWVMNRGDGSVSRPVAAVSAVDPAETYEDGFSGEAAAAAEASRLYDAVAPVSPNWREVIAAEVVGDAGDVAAMIESNEVAEALLADSPALAAAAATEATGYRVLSYSDMDATVEVFRTDAEGQAYAVPVRVVWRDGRWRLVVPEGGTWWGKVREVTS